MTGTKALQALAATGSPAAQGNVNAEWLSQYLATVAVKWTPAQRMQAGERLARDIRRGYYTLGKSTNFASLAALADALTQSA